MTRFLFLISISLISCVQDPTPIPCLYQNSLGVAESTPHVADNDTTKPQTDSNDTDFMAKTHHESEFVQFHEYPDNGMYWNSYSIGRKMAFIYSQDSSNAVIKDSLAFGTPVELDKNQDLTFGLDRSCFIRIKYRDTTGYLKIEDLNSHKFSYHKSGSNTDITVGIEQYGGNHNSMLRLEASGAIQNKLIIKNASHDYHPRRLQSPALENVLYMMYIRHSRRYSCPGVNNEQFIVLTEEGLDTLISSWSTGEVGYHDIQKIYIPMKFRNGQTLMVHDGDIERIFNPYTSTLDTMTYQEHFGIPINELVIVYMETAEPVYDSSNEEILNEFGEIKQKITAQDTLFYRWDGAKLNLVK